MTMNDLRCWTFNFPEMTQDILDDRLDLLPACVILVAVDFILLRRDSGVWVFTYLVPINIPQHDADQ